LSQVQRALAADRRQRQPRPAGVLELGRCFDADFHGFLPSRGNELGAQWRESYSSGFNPGKMLIL
jgi:hypothetical protein